METIFIKTYCYESGLWYLAKSLGDKLEEEGNRVFYIPKSKYTMMSASFKRIYPEPHNKSDFPANILPMTASQTIDKQIGNHVVKYGASKLICFESLMQKSNWVNVLKRRFKDLQVIDVPMVEWVDDRFLESRSYRIFDEIWALNDLTYRLMNKDDLNVVRKSWDFVESIFEPKDNDNSHISFLHLASTNPDYSSKNTEMVIKTFDNFMRREKPTVECRLIVQGIVPKSCKNIVDKHTNIFNYTSVASRADLVKLYQNSDCIVSPSSREGLSLSLYEGKASGCKIITTDSEPMNYIDTPYLCEVSHRKRDRSMVPISVVNPQSLYQNFISVYKDIKENS